MSLIVSIQTILLVSHYNMEAGEMFLQFLDGFQYFKFNLRFLNIVFYIKSSTNQTDYAIPSRMYYLFLEDKTTLIWFWNFLLIFLIVAVLKLIKHLTVKYIKVKMLRSNSKEEKIKTHTKPTLDIRLSTMIEVWIQYFFVWIWSGKSTFWKYRDSLYLQLDNSDKHMHFHSFCNN